MRRFLLAFPIVIALAVVAVLALIALIMLQRQRSQKLREHFGPEYEHVVNEYGDKRRAEAELAAREKRVKQLDIHPLTPEERDRFASDWQAAQVFSLLAGATRSRTTPSRPAAAIPAAKARKKLTCPLASSKTVTKAPNM